MESDEGVAAATALQLAEAQFGPLRTASDPDGAPHTTAAHSAAAQSEQLQPQPRPAMTRRSWLRAPLRRNSRPR